MEQVHIAVALRLQIMYNTGFSVCTAFLEKALLYNMNIYDVQSIQRSELGGACCAELLIGQWRGLYGVR